MTTDIYKQQHLLNIATIEEEYKIQIEAIQKKLLDSSITAKDRTLLSSHLGQVIRERDFEIRKLNHKFEEDQLINEIDTCIEANNIYGITTSKCYFVQTNNKWVSFDKDGLAMKFPNLFLNKKGNVIQHINVRLNLLNRVRDNVYIGLTNRPNELNIMDKSGWLFPKNHNTKVHEIFDILMTCLSSGNVEIRNHIEQCVLRKVSNPEDFSLPALCWFGEGGIGKNLFVRTVMDKIFCGATGSGSSDEVTGDFNGNVRGAMVFQIEEVSKKKLDMDKIKKIIGNAVFSINEKYRAPIKQENFTWWFIGTNERNGPVRLDGGKSDRRYSIIEAKNGYSIDDEILRRYPAENVQKYKQTFINQLTDAKQVEQWLFDIEQKHGVQETTPVAYHKEEYNELIEYNRRPEEIVFDLLFSCGFDYLSSTDVHLFYKENTSYNPMPQNKLSIYINKRLEEQNKAGGDKWESKTFKHPGYQKVVQGWTKSTRTKTLSKDQLTRQWNISIDQQSLTSSEGEPIDFVSPPDWKMKQKDKKRRYLDD